MTRQPLEERFWDAVEQADADRCWPWGNYRNQHGYGVLKVQGRRQLAHRVAARLMGILNDESLVVRHKCDNPPCCNPAHLIAGTQADNLRDMCERGRHGHTGSQGIRHPQAKLTDDLVRRIRTLHAGGRSQRSLGREFGVHSTTIHLVVTRKKWQHVA